MNDREAGMKKGQIVVKILDGAGFRTASFHKVKVVKEGIIFLGEGRSNNDVSAYYVADGKAVNDYIPGFRTYLAELDDGEENCLIKDKIE